MKNTILFILTIFILSLRLVNAQGCEDMLGTYRIIPFSEPVGLARASKELLTSAPLGTPFFKVERLNNQIWHKGLIRGNKYPVTLIDANKISRTTLGLDTIGNADLCYYVLNKEVKIFKVDLTKLNKQQLSILYDYISKGWRDDPLDKAIDNPVTNESYKFDLESLRKIKYFFTISYSEIGVGGFVFIFPLQKTTDKTKFAMVSVSKAKKENPQELAAKKQQTLIMNKDTQASKSCLMGGCKQMEFFLGKQQAEKLKLLSCQTIQEKWSKNPQPDQITPLMEAYLCLGDSIEKTNIIKARAYWLKGFSYLQDKSVRNLGSFRTYTINGKQETERAMMFMAKALLEKIITIDYKKKICVYPKEVDRYLSPHKFSEQDIKQTIDWGCAGRLEIDKKRFFNGEFKPEDPSLFLDR